MKTAACVVSFGTVELNARERALYSFEADAEKSNKYKNAKIYRAFTSRFITKKIKAMGEEILTVEEMLDKMKREGITKADIITTFVTEGAEYKSLTEEIYKNKGNIEILIKRPLLYKAEDYKNVARIIAAEYTKEPYDGIVFMGHGNNGSTDGCYKILESELKKAGLENIKIALVEGKPDIFDIKDKIKGESILLAPLLTASGKHVKRDMAGDGENSFKTVLENDGKRVGCCLKGLGEISEIRRYIIERAY